jgi:hypothetical protein
MAKSSVQAIKAYFERPDNIAPNGGCKLEMSELKELTNDERAELGQLCCAEIGEEWQPPAGK